MKKFEFRLERVERWRALQQRLQEDKTQQALGRVEAARAEVRKQTEHAGAAATEVTRGGDSILLAGYPAFLSKSARDLKALQLSVQRMETAAALERKRLLEMHRGTRLLELMHEARSNAWTEESNRAAEQFAGEAFLSRVQSKERARSSGG